MEHDATSSGGIGDDRFGLQVVRKIFGGMDKRRPENCCFVLVHGNDRLGCPALLEGNRVS